MRASRSTSFSFAVTISEYIAVARSPPRSLPAKSQAFRPRATPRRFRSAALFERQMRPSPRKRVMDAAEIMKMLSAQKDAQGWITDPGDVLVIIAGADPIKGTQSLSFRDPEFDRRRPIA